MNTVPIRAVLMNIFALASEKGIAPEMALRLIREFAKLVLDEMNQPDAQVHQE